MTAVIAALFQIVAKQQLLYPHSLLVEEITRQGIKDAEANFCNEQFIKKLAKFQDKAELGI
ncbi:hypothetical protein [Acinetobacter baumannii]|uniref:hypothetical protein n=1 Tax=Acinetobacter baumannii TaxID=470 RepID=UPI001D17A6D3|nr:hypothetical protein [Acinetobacter baumannii]